MTYLFQSVGRRGKRSGNLLLAKSHAFLMGDVRGVRGRRSAASGNPAALSAMSVRVRWCGFAPRHGPGLASGAGLAWGCGGAGGGMC